MNKFETIIQIARKMGGTRGGEVQLEDKEAYLTNVKRSSLYLFELNEPIGTGTFYSGQAYINAENVERREDRAWFSWKENGITRREFVPNIDPLTNFKDVFDKVYDEDLVEVPKKLLDVIMPDFFISKIKVKNNIIILTQTHSDGSVGFESEIPLKKGLIEIDHPDTKEVSFFTNDLLILAPIVDKLYMKIGDGPISIKIPTDFGTCKALIGKLIYK